MGGSSLGLFDPADEIVAADLADEVRVVRGHVRPDHVDDLVLALPAGDEAAFALDLLCHIRVLRQGVGVVLARGCRTCRPCASRSAVGSRSSAKAGGWKARCPGPRGDSGSPT